MKYPLNKLPKRPLRFSFWEYVFEPFLAAVIPILIGSALISSTFDVPFINTFFTLIAGGSVILFFIVFGRK